MKKNIMTFIGLVALFAATSFAAPQNSGKYTRAPKLTLVLAKSNVWGSFLGNEAVCSDINYVYLASYQGKLFVLDKSRRDYPVVAAISVSAAPLRSVRIDG